MDDIQRLAYFSPDNVYRYSLHRSWDKQPIRNITWVMLNPSTADAMRDDPTVTRLIRRSRIAGYDSLTVVNLFAYRSTYPQVLRPLSRAVAVGPDNNASIKLAFMQADAVVFAWGYLPPYLLWRVPDIVIMYMNTRADAPLCLGQSKTGQPRHPLHLAYTVPLRSYNAKGVEIG